MLKVYYYKPEECPWKGKSPKGPLPDGFKLAGTQEAAPQSADVFVYPHDLLEHRPEHLTLLPYFKGREKRHVFFGCSEWPLAFGLPSIFIRCNYRLYMADTDEHTVAWPWPVEDFKEWVSPPKDGFRYDVTFHGRVTASQVRQDVLRSCVEWSDLRCDFGAWKDFHGYIDDPKLLEKRKKEFLGSNRHSRLVLAPASIRGDVPYRFYEAMSQGRVPVHFGDRFVLPFGGMIPWDRFSLYFAEAEGKIAGRLIRDWLNSKTDDDILKMGMMGRSYWERYLAVEKWPEMFTMMVEKQLRIQADRVVELAREAEAAKRADELSKESNQVKEE